MTKQQRAKENLIINSTFVFIADTRYNVFHDKDSRCLKKIPIDYLRGVSKNPVRQGYAPCTICFGKEGFVKRKEPGNENASGIAGDEEKRLIDGNYTNVDKIIARCHSLRHRGYLTKSLVKSHDCIGKKCTSFEKLKSEYWLALTVTKIGQKEKRIQRKHEKIKTYDRDVFIRATLEDSGNVYITSIREESNNFLVISYIYDRHTDLSQEVRFLRKELNKNIRLKAVKGTEEAIEQLIRKPRRDMGKGTDLRKAPKVGNASKSRLQSLGIYCLEDLFNRNGDALYRLDCHKSGKKIDRRYLTAYRNAVKYAKSL